MYILYSATTLNLHVLRNFWLQNWNQYTLLHKTRVNFTVANLLLRSVISDNQKIGRWRHCESHVQIQSISAGLDFTTSQVCGPVTYWMYFHHAVIWPCQVTSERLITEIWFNAQLLPTSTTYCEVHLQNKLDTSLQKGQDIPGIEILAFFRISLFANQPFHGH